MKAPYEPFEDWYAEAPMLQPHPSDELQGSVLLGLGGQAGKLGDV